MSDSQKIDADDIDLEAKRVLLQNEIQRHKNDRFVFEARLIVNKRIGAQPEILKQIESGLELTQKAIMAYQEMLDALKNKK